MSDLISKSALIKLRRKVVEYDEAGFSMDYFAVPVEEINNAPTVEARPVVHGSWKTEFTALLVVYRCSECNCATALGQTNFCPNCGADMRKKVE